MCEDHSPYSTTQSDRRKAGRPKRRMGIDLIRRVMEESRDTGLREIIPSTMGEPLLYRHFDEILDLCSEYGVKLNLTTNGTFPKRGARAWAERIVPVTSDVKVSWNGATKATHENVMLGSNWERVLENVRAFIGVRDAHAARGGNRCRVTFQLTFMEVNVAELPGIVKLAAGLGVDRVKGHHLWVHSSQMRGQSMRRSPEAIARWNDIVDVGIRGRRVLTGCRAATVSCWRTSSGWTQTVRMTSLLTAYARFWERRPGWPPTVGSTRAAPLTRCDERSATSGTSTTPACTTSGRVRSTGDLQANYMKNALCQGCNMRRPADL